MQLRWLVVVSLMACGGQRDMSMTMSAGGGSGGASAGTGGSGGSAGTGGSGSSSGGPICSSETDCAYWYCECTGTSVPVNSRTCSNGHCAPASAACTSGCAAFGHQWTGRTLGSSGSGGGGGSSSSGAPGSSCTTKDDCTALTCGCTDGALLTVHDCYGGTCNFRSSACEDACVDTNHGHWDGI
jgi:hypothetical protein